MKSQTTVLSIPQTRPCRSLLLVKRKKFKNIRQCHDKKGNQKQGMWNLTQTVKYIAFIKDNTHRFESEETRRLSRVFCLMSRQVKSRSSVQCRSHHQKMIQTYGQIPQIITHYQSNVIPYYSAKIREPEPKSSQNTHPQPFYHFQQIGNVLRLQIREECIGYY